MAQPGTADNNASTKNVLLATGAVVLILLCGFFIYHTYAATQPHVVAKMNITSPKGEYLKSLKGGSPSGGGPAKDPSDLNPSQ